MSSEMNDFILTVTRLVFVIVLTLGLRIVRQVHVSNTGKLFMSILWTIFLLRCGIYVLNSDYSRPLDPVLKHIMLSEINAYYQWFFDQHYVFVTFGLAVATSRVIDVLRI